MVDILLASYNGEKYIKEQLESIVNQTYKEWRLIIHDDQSLDRTTEILQEMIHSFEKQYHSSAFEKKIKLSVNSESCKGAAANFLGLLKEAKNDYVMFCDQDDVWYPDKIEKSLKLMKRLEKKYGSHKPLLVYTDLAVVDEQQQMISSSFRQYMNIPLHLRLPRLLMQNSVTGCTILMNRSLYKLLMEAGNVEKIVMHDHFAALLAVIFGNTAYIPEATMKYRQHGKNAVGASNARSLAFLWKRYRQGKNKFREDLYRSMVQAGYLLELYGDRICDNEDKQLIYRFSHLYKRNKLQRVFFFIKYRVIKYGWIRAIMQIIWG